MFSQTHKREAERSLIPFSYTHIPTNQPAGVTVSYTLLNGTLGFQEALFFLALVGAKGLS